MTKSNAVESKVAGFAPWAQFLATFLVTSACGTGGQRPPPADRPVGKAVQSSALPPRAPDSPGALYQRTFTGRYHSGGDPIPVTMWIEPGRETDVGTEDPCCGVSYDGNRYQDSLATCAPEAAAGHEECGPGRQAVYPGLADDPVCAERRRCVPMPEIRIVLLDGTIASVVDEEGHPLAEAADESVTTHHQVSIGRDGFVHVAVNKGAAAQSVVVAADFGARYSIYVRAGVVQRVARDP